MEKDIVYLPLFSLLAALPTWWWHVVVIDVVITVGADTF